MPVFLSFGYTCHLPPPALFIVVPRRLHGDFKQDGLYAVQNDFGDFGIGLDLAQVDNAGNGQDRAFFADAADQIRLHRSEHAL